MSWPRTCAVAGCGKAMRPNGSKPVDWPGTVRHSARGMCNSCYELSRRRPNMAKTVTVVAGDPCMGEGCGRQLRPSNTTEAEHPGMWRNHAKRMCTTCYNRAHPTVRKPRAVKPPAPAKPPAVPVPAAPRVPASWWIKGKPKPLMREQKTGAGQHVYERVPTDPPHITAEAKRKVFANSTSGADALQTMRMLGLLDTPKKANT